MLRRDLDISSVCQLSSCNFLLGAVVEGDEAFDILSK